MTSCALVVSDDLILRSNARQVLKKTGIDCISSGTIGLDKIIISSKFDAVILDYPGINDAIKAIHNVRTGKVNRYSIILILVSDSSAAAMVRGAGASFTIQRSPSLLENMERAVQSAYALIMRERRRYERHAVSVSVEVLCNGRTANAKMIDISEHGACIECSLPPCTKSLELAFSLPGLNHRLRIEGTAAWTRGSEMGIRFTSIEEASRPVLTQWLKSQQESRHLGQ